MVAPGFYQHEMSKSEYPAGERGEFAADARLSPTLPSRYYRDADIHRQELRCVFHRSWCYVGPASGLDQAGDYRVERVADQCILLIRAEESAIRAFFNVCQHRGHELLEGTGKRLKKFVCPYHAWAYALDGRLLNAPHTDKMSNFDRAQFGLKPVRLVNCAGLLFANLDPEAADFEREYPGFEQIIEDCLRGLEGFRHAAALDFDIAANWKIVVDNFSEGYHIPVAHRKLSRVLDIGAGNRARVEQRYAFFESRSKAGFSELEIEPGSPYRSWTLWPNTCMLSLPGCNNLFVLRMGENGPGRCLEHVDLLTDADHGSSVLESLEALFAEQFNAEDIAIVESVHRGLNSLGYDQGRYVVDDNESWYSESGLHRFHRLLLQALRQG